MRTERISCTKRAIFIWKSLPNATWTCERRERVSLAREQEGHRASEKETHLGRVQVVLPLGGEVVRVLDDAAHELLRVDDAVLVGDHAARDGEYRAEDAYVEQDGAAGRDLKVEEGVRVDEREEDEDSRERAGEEGDEARHEDRLGLRVVVDVLVGERMGEGEAVLEVVWQLVELAELPPRERRELARADRRRVLVVFLHRV